MAMLGIIRELSYGIDSLPRH